MKIAIGSDHRGFAHKEFIQQNISHYTWIDVGTYDQTRTDYPIYTEKVVQLYVTKNVDYGVLLCSTGIGMAIAANRHTGIYAAIVWNEEIACQAKAEDNSNILVLPADSVSYEQAISIITIWLSTSFKGGRYAERLEMIDNK
jgi:ribose 5-phosphate isomerase B